MLPLVEDWPPCPGCEGMDLAALHIINNSKRLVPSPFLALLGCRRCGLAFTAPRPSAAALAAFYDKDIEGGWTRDEIEPGKLARKHAAAAQTLAPVTSRVGGHGRRALDFGCGAGAMLDVLQDGGWETWGLEPARLGEAAARRHRLIDTLPGEPTFDLVVLNHVLEHLLEPGALLTQIAAACRPEAMLLVGVPALEGVAVTGDFKYGCSALHINSFTRDSLANVMRVAGWAPASMDVPSGPVRMVLYASRAATPLDPVPGALASAVDALRDYGRRLDARGEYTVCPLPSLERSLER